MEKAAVDAALAALESSIHTIDFWALICGVFVAVFLAGEIWFIGAHWLKESSLKPLRERQAQLNELEITRLTNETTTAKKTTEELRQKNLELEKAVAPRILEASAPAAVLKQFSNTEAMIGAVFDFDADRLAGSLVAMLRMAGWTVGPLPPDNWQYFDGVEIEYVSQVGAIPDEAGKKRKIIAETLAAELNKQNIEAKTRWIAADTEMPGRAPVPPEVIVIRVGARPYSYFLEQRFPALKESRERSDRLKKQLDEMSERLNKQFKK